MLMSLALPCALPGVASADNPIPTPADGDSSAVVEEPVAAPRPAPKPGRRPQLEALVPELADAPYRLDPGPRPFQHRVSMSPSVGYLGSESLFAFRLGYYPDSWLGYEATVAHNPGESVHAVLHTVSAIVRHPLAGRFQPYVSGGYGMIMVFPGQSLNASPVTKNALAVGGGLEFFIRSDLALRADVRHATVFGRERDRDGVVAYGYLQETVGLSFYRSVSP
jgi:hypothetical protein